jgi:hypothetical protein
LLAANAEPVKLDDVTLDKLVANATAPVEALSKAAHDGAAALKSEAGKAVEAANAGADHAMATVKAEADKAEAAGEGVAYHVPQHLLAFVAI